MRKPRSLRDILILEKSQKIGNYLKYGIILIIITILIYILLTNKNIITQLASGYGLLGLFIASIIANATVLLPMPIDILFLALASQTNSITETIIIALVLGLGAGIGEMSAYIAGALGSNILEKTKKIDAEKMKQIRENIDNLGMYFIYFSAVVPFPFDIIGITAGMLKYNPKKFFIAALAGKTTRYIIIALSAYYGINTIKNIFL
ncbi:MAG: VTT domain-containing protein [Candidatus Diapherotrites archaeon]